MFVLHGSVKDALFVFHGSVTDALIVLYGSVTDAVFVPQESVTNSVDECLAENPLALRPAKRPAQLDSPASSTDGLPTPLVPQVSNTPAAELLYTELNGELSRCLRTINIARWRAFS